LNQTISKAILAFKNKCNTLNQTISKAILASCWPEYGHGESIFNQVSPVVTWLAVIQHENFLVVSQSGDNQGFPYELAVEKSHTNGQTNLWCMEWTLLKEAVM